MGESKAAEHFKKKVKFINQKLLRVFQKVKKYLCIFMVNGMIYVEVHI